MSILKKKFPNNDSSFHLKEVEKEISAKESKW